MQHIIHDDDLAQANLKRHRNIATGLLGIMGGLTIAGYAGPYLGYIHDSLLLQTLRAGTKAGFIGGIADWFAVTALFRHPLGLPIPHTAILPAQKEKLAIGLGRFIAGQVFTEEEVTKILEKVDFPTLLGKAISEPSTVESITHAVVITMPSLLDRLEDGRASAALGRLMPRLLSGESAATIVAKALNSLVEGEHHQEVLTFFLIQLKNFIKNKEDELRILIEDRVREQGGRFLGWAIGGSIATKVLMAASQELERIDPQNSELRDSFSQWIRSEIQRIEQDPQRGKEISEALLSVFGHESIKGWGEDIWQRMRTLIEEDTQNHEGWIHGVIKDMLAHISEQLKTDSAVRKKIIVKSQQFIFKGLPYGRSMLSDFIAKVVNGWDADAASRKIELRVGKDLQFVRVNGTLVGFAAGAVLFLLLYICFGKG